MQIIFGSKIFVPSNNNIINEQPNQKEYDFSDKLKNSEDVVEEIFQEYFKLSKWMAWEENYPTDFRNEKTSQFEKYFCIIRVKEEHS